MIAENPLEELVYYLTRSKKNSFHYGEISIGVQKLLEALKEKGFVVHFTDKSSQPELIILSKAECEHSNLVFEHQFLSCID